MTIRTQDIAATLAALPTMKGDAAQRTLAELVLVRVYYAPAPNGARGEHDTMMLESEVPNFVAATLELHFDPGVNPHTHGKASVVWRISLLKLMEPVAYWHTTPGLHDAFGKGARVLHWNEAYNQILWSHPDCIRADAAALANSDRAECDLPELKVCTACRGLKDDDRKIHVPEEAHCVCAPEPIPAQAGQNA